MTRPIQTLLWMSLFTILVITGAFFLAEPLHQAFTSNVVFNGIIMAVLVIGIGINFRQVLQLYPEIAWIKHFQSDASTASKVQPKLLSSMARLLEGKEDLSLSTSSMHTMLESLRTRIDDSRDLSRYMISVLVFLGLLGTFWGLMSTVSAVGSLIGGMSVEASSGEAIFESLKNSLAEPLSGMGIAFSSSLFGLSGSLVVGFLDLQAGHAQNRFINELEEWLSSSTRISSGIIGEEGGAIGAPAYVQALLEKTADALEKMQRASSSDDNQRDLMIKQLDNMRDTFNRFNELLDKQNERFEQLNSSQNEIARLLKASSEQPQQTSDNEELRSELRLLSKTIANALANRGSS